MKYELVVAADLPQYLAEAGGMPTAYPAPPGWAYVAVPEGPDAIMALAEQFEIEFLPTEKV